MNTKIIAIYEKAVAEARKLLEQFEREGGAKPVISADSILAQAQRDIE